MANQVDVNPPGHSDNRDRREKDFNRTRQDLVEAVAKLEAIQRILNNPYHQVGYLVNAAPIQRILDGGGA